MKYVVHFFFLAKCEKLAIEFTVRLILVYGFKMQIKW